MSSTGLCEVVRIGTDAHRVIGTDVHRVIGTDVHRVIQVVENTSEEYRNALLFVLHILP